MIGALLLSFSYPLIVYSSEARGYGLMVFFTVWAYAIVDGQFGWTASQASAASTQPEQGHPAFRHSPLLFSTAVILGFLAHPTFIHAYGALAVWTIYRLEEQSSSMKGVFRELVRWHLAPAIFLLLYYNVFVIRLQISGADPSSMIDVIISTATLALGGAEHGALADLALVVWAAGSSPGYSTFINGDFGAFLFFCVAIVIMPTLMILAHAVLAGGDDTILSTVFPGQPYRVSAANHVLAWRRFSRRDIEESSLRCSRRVVVRGQPESHGELSSVRPRSLSRGVAVSGSSHSRGADSRLQ